MKNLNYTYVGYLYLPCGYIEMRKTIYNGNDPYDLFGRYGVVCQVPLGNDSKTKGTAFVVYGDVMTLVMHFSVLTN